MISALLISGEMVDFSKSDKMIKISGGKGDKPTLTTDLIFYSLLEIELHLNENEIFLKFSN